MEPALLPRIRRFEAVSFRSFPSTITYYDGTWAIRLTVCHSAKRLNSVNPLDPYDHRDIEKRIERVERKFVRYGRPLVFRQSPLAPPELERVLDERGWSRFDESIVMVAELGDLGFETHEFSQKVSEVGTWVDRFLELSEVDKSTSSGLQTVLSEIRPESGLFLQRNEKETVAALRCVQDNELAGIFDVVTGAAFKRQKHAQALLRSALCWAKQAGASYAWLQVVADNQPAIRLYERFGFSELYRYQYRKAPE